MTPGLDTAALADLAVVAARRACAVHDRYRGGPLDATSKSSPVDPVTVADAEAEKVIIETLLDARPDDGVLGEEGGESVVGRSGVRWIIDPIDGTVNFMYGLPAVAVSIAADVDGETVAGVVLDTGTDTCFRAEKGGGAFADDRRLTLGPPPSLSHTLLATGFPYVAEARRTHGHVIAEMLAEVRDIRRLGSAAIDLCSVALGQVDAYAETAINHWDRAAGALVVTEAGGIVTDLDGGPPGHWTVACHPGLHEPLVSALRAAITRMPDTDTREPRD
jgi:myo-inositol-1(or 4)-monophosphatase